MLAHSAVRFSLYAGAALVLAAFLVSLYFYPSVPDTMVTHWNAAGQPDGSMPKDVGLFLLPFIMGIFTAGYYWLVTRKSTSKVGTLPLYPPELHGFILVFLVFLILVQLGTIAWNLGHVFSVSQWVFVGIGMLFLILGKMLERVTPNWLFGIRTPWTLANTKVWRDVHARGGKLFMLLGFLALITSFFPDNPFQTFFLPLLAIVLYLIAYSYLRYQTETTG
ncbi:MAG: DUF1648 domain-containing protein [Candidatus Diapherotrites archaeon]|nr:DUF1648 domain-containing protein [Candidatus Diapherotrites archaeon]MDZ4256987.1 DUF1648 domain-containing protein [archaeon]